MAGEIANAFVALMPTVGSGFGTKLSQQITPQAARASETAGRAAGSRFTSTFGGAIKGIAATIGTAFAIKKVGDFFGSIVGEAQEARKAGALTAAVIKSTGGAAKISAEQVGLLSEALSNKTGIDDEVIQSGANMLLTFKNIRNEVGSGNDIFNQSTALLTDMSAAMGTDMKSAAIQMGKALNDPIAGMGALSRVGVQFTDVQKETIKGLVETGDLMGAQKIILGELESQFGGAAEALATPGDKARVAWGNFKEFLGGVFLPVYDRVMTSVTGTLTRVVNFFRNAASEGTFLARAWQAGFTLAKRVLSGIADFARGVFSEIREFVAANQARFQAWGHALYGVFSIGRDLIAEFFASFKGAGSSLPSVGSLLERVASTVDKLTAALYQGALVLFRHKDAIKALMPVLAGLIAGVVAYKAVIGPIIAVTRAWAVAQGILNAVMLLNPVGLVVAAIAGLAVVLVLAYKKSEAFRKVIAGVFSVVRGWIDSNRATFEAWGARIAEIWSGLQALWSALWMRVQQFWKAYGARIMATVSAVWGHIQAIIARVWEIIKAVVSTALGIISGVIQTVTSIIRGDWSGAWDGIKQIFGAVWDGIKTILVNILPIIGQILGAGLTVLRLIWDLAWAGIKAALVAVWDGIAGFFAAWWSSIVTQFTGWLSAVGSVLSGAWALIRGAVVSAWGAIVGFFVDTWANIRGIFTAALGAIAGFLAQRWANLKANTTAVWTAVVQFLSGTWETIKSLISTAVDFVVGFLVQRWENIKANTSAAWTAVKSLISSAWEGIKTLISTALNTVKGWISAAWTAVMTTTSLAWGGIKSAVVTKVGELVEFVRGIPGRILSALGNVGSLLVQAGKNIIQGLLNGISSMLGRVGDVMGDVVGTIVDFLPWSPAKEGPLHNFPPQKGGQNIARMLAEGMLSEQKMIEKAAGVIAGAASIEPYMPDLSSVRKGARQVAASAAKAQEVHYHRTMYATVNNPVGEHTSDTLGRDLDKMMASL